MGLFGLWLGPDVAIIFIFVTISILIACVDWAEEIENEAKKRELEKEKLSKIEEEAEETHEDEENFKKANDINCAYLLSFTFKSSKKKTNIILFIMVFTVKWPNLEFCRDREREKKIREKGEIFFSK